MKAIDQIDFKELRQAIKSLNNSGIHPEGKMKAIGDKENLIKEFTRRIEDIPDDVELPETAAEFYHDIYADEFGDEDYKNEMEEADEEIEEIEAETETTEEEADASTVPDVEDDPEQEELLDDAPFGKYDKKTLLNLIKQVQPAVDEHILFATESIVAYNGEVCMKIPFFTDINCAINEVDLYKTLKKFPAKSFQMTFDKEKNELQLTAPGVRAGYISTPRINLIDSLEEVIDDSEKIEWKPLPEDFLKGVDLVHFAASKITKFGTATCLYVNGNELVATDRTRISHYKMKSDMGEFFVRADNIKHLKRLVPTGFGLTKNWIHFQNEQYTTVSFKLMHGDFPDYHKLIDYTISGKSIPITKEFESMIKMNQTMAKTDGRLIVLITVSDGKIKCRSANERGWIETDVETDYDGDSFTFSIDPAFLIDALKHGVIKMGLASNTALALEAENFKHLVALINN